MATNKERTSSAAMRKLLLQSASKKEQEIQQIGSVAESTIPNLRLSTPSMKRWKNRLQSKKPSKNLSRNKWKSRNPNLPCSLLQKQKKAKSAEKILGISGRAKIKEHRSNPDIQRNPQKAEADCYGHWIRNAQHRKQHSWRHIDQP